MGVSVKTVMVLVIVLILTLPVFGEVQNPKSQEDLIKAGIALYDTGDYEGAIKKYKEALNKNPSDTEAIYELAMAYTATKEYKKCIEIAESGLKLNGPEQPILFAISGTCYSSSGQAEKAIKIFREGLKEYPDNISLNFNIAITLGNTGKIPEAKTHLKKILEINSAHLSATFILAKLFEMEGNRIPAIITYMRYLMLDPNSVRSSQSSQAVLYLMKAGVKQNDNNNTTISLNPNTPKDEGDFGPADLFLSLKVAEVYEKDEKTSTELDRQFEVVSDFIKYIQESTTQPTAETFIWKNSATPLIKLAEAGHLKAFTYYLLASSGNKEAGEWLQNNGEALTNFDKWLRQY